MSAENDWGGERMEEMQLVLTKTGQDTVKNVMSVVKKMTPEQKQQVLAFFHGVEFGNRLADSHPSEVKG